MSLSVGKDTETEYMDSPGRERATGIVAKHIEGMVDLEPKLTILAVTAMRHAEVVKQILRQEGNAGLVSTLGHHLLADSLQNWVLEDLFCGSPPHETARELTKVALECVDWVALADRCFTQLAKRTPARKAA
jgi:hypothetical protein